MIYLQLFFEFLKIGFFSYGGGYATVPFLYQIAKQYNWYTFDELIKMTAVASITPGPIGINVATYAGVKTAGIIGALVATLAEMLPSLILIIIISKILKKFKDSFLIKSALLTLKPIGCALLASVAVGLIKSEINSISSILLLLFLLLLSWNSKKDPLFYILIAGCIGIILTLISLQA